MRSLTRIRADLERLEGHLDAVGRVEQTPGVALMRQGLDDVRQDMVKELDEGRRARLEVVLHGAPVIGHEIRVDALAKLLHSLQESISSVAQALTGKATSRAAIPGPLREMTGLRLASVFEGSFGAVLRGPGPDRPEQPLLEFAEQVPTLLDDALDRVLTVIELASSPEVNDDPIIEAVLPLGTRTFKHLASLSSAIVDEDMTAAISWRSPAVPPREVALTSAVARRLDDVLGRNKMTEREVAIEGRLGTVSDIRSRVELQTETDIISAKVVEELVPALGDYYTRRVVASFQVTTVRSQVTGQERNAYTLIGLAHLDDLEAESQTELT